MTPLEYHQKRVDETCDAQDRWRMRDHYNGVEWGTEPPKKKVEPTYHFDWEAWNRHLQNRYNERYGL